MEEKTFSENLKIKLFDFFSLRIFEHIMGVKVKATMLEKNTAPAMDIPNSLNNLPVLPPIIESGTNTAIRDKVVAITANPI